MSVHALPLPVRCKSPEEAIGAAGLIAHQTINIVIVAQDSDGITIINAGQGDSLTNAEMVWMLIVAQQMVLQARPK